MDSVLIILLQEVFGAINKRQSICLNQSSPTFFAPGTNFVGEDFTTDNEWVELG